MISRHGLSKNVLRPPVVWNTLRIVGKAQIAAHMISISEAFQFGRGEPMPAKDRAYMPSKIGSVYLLLGASD